MRSSTERDLTGIFQSFKETHPTHTAVLNSGHEWRWIDSNSGNDIVLLLPGFMGEAETSFLYVQSLEQLVRVISLTFPPSVGTIGELCDGLVAFLDSLSIQQVTVLGGSSSGFVAQALVRRHPLRVSRLILTHTGLPQANRARTAKLYQKFLHWLPFLLVRRIMQFSTFAYFPRQTSGHVFWRTHFSDIIRRQTRESLGNRFALMNDFHGNYKFQPGDLTEWHGNILIMEMSRDSLTNPAEQASMRKLYQGALVYVFSETAHFDSVEQPDEQILEIKNFLLQPGRIKHDK